jgi:hypothetical protein
MSEIPDGYFDKYLDAVANGVDLTQLQSKSERIAPLNFQFTYRGMTAIDKGIEQQGLSLIESANGLLILGVMLERFSQAKALVVADKDGLAAPFSYTIDIPKEDEYGYWSIHTGEDGREVRFRRAEINTSLSVLSGIDETSRAHSCSKDDAVNGLLGLGWSLVETIGRDGYLEITQQSGQVEHFSLPR